jgi:hypothetical protein
MSKAGSSNTSYFFAPNIQLQIAKHSQAIVD